MSDNESYKNYLKDTRITCKYGEKCYQKNVAHLNKYKHPPKSNTENEEHSSILPPAKKFKIHSESHHTTENKEKTNKPQEVSSESTLDTNDNLSLQPSDSTKKHERESNCLKPNSQNSSSDKHQFIKNKFLVEMPQDFYDFWDFCKRIKSSNPSEALAPINILLVGPYDVLADKFTENEISDEKYLVHSRYFYDPPEFLTVIKGDDKTGFHIGYFRDEPEELPVFLACNSAKENGEFTVCGDNIFAAVYIYIQNFKKTADPFKKMNITKYESLIKKEAEKLQLSLLDKTQNINQRNRKVVTKTFNKLGIVVPYDRKTQLGYRELTMNNKDLKKIFDKLKLDVGNNSKILSDLQPVLTYASIAIDECDFGTGLELGLNILAHGVKELRGTALQFLRSSYKLLKRDTFARIAEAHLSNWQED